MQAPRNATERYLHDCGVHKFSERTRAKSVKDSDAAVQRMVKQASRDTIRRSMAEYDQPILEPEGEPPVSRTTTQQTQSQTQQTASEVT